VPSAAAGQRFVIIGGGHAGAHLASSLVRYGWTGSITVFGDEAHPPYRRPTMSKSVLAGREELRDVLIRPIDEYERHGIVLELSATVMTIDRNAKFVGLADGRAIPYDRLAICTGARPREIPFPGAELDGIHYLRSHYDVVRLRSAIAYSRRTVIIGGGYLGLEVASVLVQVGLEVTVLEAEDRVLQRVAGAPVSRFYTRIHREAGVAVRTGETVLAFEGSGHVSAVRLGDGTSVAADLVIVAVGAVPNVELAVLAGLTVDNGIVVDDNGATDDPDISAAGDCANHYDPVVATHVRHESVPNAMDRARVIAAVACGKPPPPYAEPWFWSDQYDVKLQIAGSSRAYDEIVLRGDPDSGRSFVTWYLAEGHLIAADCVNRPRDFLAAQRLLAARAPVDAEALENESVSLSDLVKAAVPSG
jgi:3-phenylpropionate/trans-cinnamate dioxygenase ferredoxin reductase component